MPRRHAIRLEILRGLQEVAELHPLVAADAGHRRGARQIRIGKLVDDALAEPVLVIEHVMREAHRLRDPARIVDVAPRTAGPLLRQRRPVVVELQRHADDVVTLLRQHRRHHRTVDAAGHRDHHARLRRRLREAERIERRGAGRIWPDGHHERSLSSMRREYSKILRNIKGLVHARLRASNVCKSPGV